MQGSSLQRLIRHVYRDGSHSFHHAPVEANRDDALVSKDGAVSAYDPADRFTDWPPQPVTVWLCESGVWP